MRWFLIGLLVFVEFMSCLNCTLFQPWSTIIGCLIMFFMALVLSANWKSRS
jgi:hypothetical protein